MRHLSFFEKIGIPYFCFHDVDAAPEGASLKEFHANVNHIADIFEQKMQSTGVELLWGTANLFSNKRFCAGASTNPNPEIFAYAAAQVTYYGSHTSPGRPQLCTVGWS